VIIEWSPDEHVQIFEWAKARTRSAKAAGHRDHQSAPVAHERVLVDAYGIAGEWATHRALWLSAADFRPAAYGGKRSPDLPHGVEVRARSPKARKDDLPIRANDSKERWWVLVLADFPACDVAGFIHGREAVRQVRQHPEWLTPNGTMWVPRKALRPIEDLRGILADE
jgi:hypothetical protein